MVDIQKLIKKGVGEIYVMVSSKENVLLLMKVLDSINFFTNTLGWVDRNNYESKRGIMKYLVLNLVSKEIAFNRNNPTEELLENKLFAHELDQFINAGPKNKTKILMKIKQLIEAKISYLEVELSNLRKNLEKVEKGLIPNSSTIRVCPDCGTRNLHYYVDTNNWCCACC